MGGRKEKLAGWANNNMQPARGSKLRILSVRCGLARIIILCASFRLVIHPPEENPGRALFLFSKEGLGARWRKESLGQDWDEKGKVDCPL